MKNANKFRRNQLILGLIFTAIGIIGAWGMVEIAYSSYEYSAPINRYFIAPESTVLPFAPELFGPKKFDQNAWEFQERFEYKSWKETINC